MKKIYEIPSKTIHDIKPQTAIDKTTGIWVDHVKHFYDTNLSNNICNYLLTNNIKTVYEFGCGNGLYTKNMLNHGLDVDSSDGNPNTFDITDGISYTMDISKKLNLEKRDAVLCLEVGEHIPREYESVVLDNICDLSDNIVIMSWAIVGQSGHGHVNCRNNDYIIEQMKNRRFEYRKIESDFLRKNSELNWFKNTIMVFKKN